MSTIAKMIPRPQATSTQLKQEVNDYLRRASNLEQQKEYDEASVLYKRVVSLIQGHEGTSAVDNELAAMKRDANQYLMRSSLKKDRPEDSNNRYRSMVGQLERQLSRPDDNNDSSDEIFEDPSAFEVIREKDRSSESNAETLFQLDQGTKLFYLAKDGVIQTTSETLPLTLFQVR